MAFVWSLTCYNSQLILIPLLSSCSQKTLRCYKRTNSRNNCFKTQYTKRICDALQENREQVAQAYFEIRTTEVGKVKNNSSVNFGISLFLHTLVCFLSPPCNFQRFSHKNSIFSAACHIQTIEIGNFKGQFLKITLLEKPLTVLYTNGHISNSRRSVNLILVSN